MEIAQARPQARTGLADEIVHRTRTTLEEQFGGVLASGTLEFPRPTNRARALGAGRVGRVPSRILRL
jgi:hypothetical protein